MGHRKRARGATDASGSRARQPIWLQRTSGEREAQALESTAAETKRNAIYVTCATQNERLALSNRVERDRYMGMRAEGARAAPAAPRSGAGRIGLCLRGGDDGRLAVVAFEQCHRTAALGGTRVCVASTHDSPSVLKEPHPAARLAAARREAGVAPRRLRDRRASARRRLRVRADAAVEPTRRSAPRSGWNPTAFLGSARQFAGPPPARVASR